MGVGKPCAAQSKMATPSTCAMDLNPVMDLSLAVGATLVLGSRRNEPVGTICSCWGRGYELLESCHELHVQFYSRILLGMELWE